METVNLEQYRLKGQEDLAEVRIKLGDKYAAFEAAIYRMLAVMPVNTWYDYKKSMHPSNIGCAIKIICRYIDMHPSMVSYVEFNPDFTLVRRMHEKPKTLFNPYGNRKQYQAK